MHKRLSDLGLVGKQQEHALFHFNAELVPYSWSIDKAFEARRWNLATKLRCQVATSLEKVESLRVWLGESCPCSVPRRLVRTPRYNTGPSVLSV